MKSILSLCLFAGLCPWTLSAQTIYSISGPGTAKAGAQLTASISGVGNPTTGAFDLQVPVGTTFISVKPGPAAVAAKKIIICKETPRPTIHCTMKGAPTLAIPNGVWALVTVQFPADMEGHQMIFVVIPENAQITGGPLHVTVQ